MLVPSTLFLIFGVGNVFQTSDSLASQYIERRLRVSESLATIRIGQSADEVQELVGIPSHRLKRTTRLSYRDYDVWRYSFVSGDISIDLGEVWIDQIEGEVALIKSSKVDFAALSKLPPDFPVLLSRIRQTSGLTVERRSYKTLYYLLKELQALRPSEVAILLKEFDTIDLRLDIVNFFIADFTSRDSPWTKCGQVEVIIEALLGDSLPDSIRIYNYDGLLYPFGGRLNRDSRLMPLVWIDGVPLVTCLRVFTRDTHMLRDGMIEELSRRQEYNMDLAQSLPDSVYLQRRLSQWIASVHKQDHAQVPDFHWPIFLDEATNAIKVQFQTK